MAPFAQDLEPPQNPGRFSRGPTDRTVAHGAIEGPGDTAATLGLIEGAPREHDPLSEMRGRPDGATGEVRGAGRPEVSGVFCVSEMSVYQAHERRLAKLPSQFFSFGMVVALEHP